MKKEIFIESLGRICRFYGESHLISRILDDPFLYHFIPESLIVDGGNIDIDIVQDKNLNRQVRIEYPTCRFGLGLSPRDVITLGEFLLERNRQETKGIYSLSSASASSDGKAVVFWGGATNLGKTSSMLSLVKEEGFEFLTDEKTLLDLRNRKIIGGSRSIATRKKVVRKTLEIESSTEFCEMDSNGINLRAYLFIYPHLDRSNEIPISYKFSSLDFFWLLNRELSQPIRGTTRLIYNFSQPLPSLDTDSVALERTMAAKRFCEEVECHYFQGSVEQIRHFVKGLYN